MPARLAQLLARRAPPRPAAQGESGPTLRTRRATSDLRRLGRARSAAGTLASLRAGDVAASRACRGPDCGGQSLAPGGGPGIMAGRLRRPAVAVCVRRGGDRRPGRLRPGSGLWDSKIRFGMVTCGQSGGDVVLAGESPRTCLRRIRCSARLIGSGRRVSVLRRCGDKRDAADGADAGRSTAAAAAGREQRAERALTAAETRRRSSDHRPTDRRRGAPRRPQQEPARPGRQHSRSSTPSRARTPSEKSEERRLRVQRASSFARGVVGLAGGGLAAAPSDGVRALATVPVLVRLLCGRRRQRRSRRERSWRRRRPDR